MLEIQKKETRGCQAKTGVRSRWEEAVESGWVSSQLNSQDGQRQEAASASSTLVNVHFKQGRADPLSTAANPPRCCLPC